MTQHHHRVCTVSHFRHHYSTAAVTSIAPAGTVVWRKFTLPRVILSLHNQSGQSWSNIQIWSKLVKSGQKVKD